MRPSLLPNLLAAAARNLARGMDDARCSSSGRASPAAHAGRAGGGRWPACATARPRRGTGPCATAAGRRARRQGRRAGGAGRARRQARQRAGRGRGARPGTIPAAPAACARAEPVLAAFGELHPRVAGRVRPRGAGRSPSSSISTRCRCPRRGPSKARPALEPLPFPPVERDFAFVVDATVAGRASCCDAIAGVDARADPRGAAVRRLCGQGRAGEGKKSLAVAVRLQAAERTLTEAEIEAVAGQIVAAAAEGDRSGAAASDDCLSRTEMATLAEMAR